MIDKVKKLKKKKYEDKYLVDGKNVSLHYYHRINEIISFILKYYFVSILFAITLIM